MKQIFTFIVATIITMSSTGQSSVRNRPVLPDGFRQIQTALPDMHLNPYMERGSILQPGFSHPVTPGPAESLVLMQQLDSYIYQEYDEATSQWLNRSMNEFGYDANGNNTSDIFYTWNAENELYEKSLKQEFTFDNSGLAEQLSYEWDAGTSSWVLLFRWLYSYNGDGYMSMAYSYYWTGSVWEMAGRDQRTYDEEGQVVLQVLSWWDGSGSQWVNSNKIENTYNSDGTLSVSTESNWDLITNEWIFINMDEYSYNDGYLIQQNTLTWNTLMSRWENETQVVFSYDSFMNIILSQEYAWDGSQWVDAWKSEMTYNNDFTADQLILPWFFSEAEGELQHMLTGITEFGFNGLSYELTTRSMFNYSQVDLTGIADHEINKAVVFPQPASGQVTISWGSNSQELDLSLYDLTGKMMYEKSISNNTSVPLSMMMPGLYLYRLSGKSGTMYSGKISVR
ncbi:MAG: T9SS type A sorting domain-containing protein [Bacteroidota bacterium]